MNFGDIVEGDMFNTMAARWVKTSETQAICVWSALVSLGEIHEFSPDTAVIVLFSANQHAIEAKKRFRRLVDEVYGNLAIENPSVTREFVEEQLRLREEAKLTS